MDAQGRFHLKHNVEYILRDKYGNIKPIWQPNEKAINAMKSGLLSPTDDILKTPEYGEWSDKMQISNTITTTGKAGVASRINGSGGEAAFTYIALGTGTNASAVGDTTLQTEATTNGAQRANATASRVTTDTTNDTARLVNTFNFTGSFSITESGVLNASSVGTLLARQVFTAIAVVNGDSLQVTWNFDVD